MRSAALALTFLTFLLGNVSFPQDAPNDPQASWFVARIYYAEPSDIRKLAGLDLLSYNNREEKYVLAIVDEATATQLKAAGWRVETDAETTERLRPPPQKPGPAPLATFYGGYRTLDTIYSDLQQVADDHPAITELVDYGDSYSKTAGGVTAPGGERIAGYDLLAMKITNPNVAGPKPGCFLMFGLHAREITTPELGMRMLDWLTQGYGTDPDATWIVDWHETWIIPVANPDGRWYVELGTQAPYSGPPFMWRKNGNPSNGAGAWPPLPGDHSGIDLNRNHGFMWGGPGTSGDPVSGVYRGPAPSSEAETQALENLILSLFPDQRGPGDLDAAPDDTTGILISTHSSGQWVIWPWCYTAAAAAPNDAGLADIGTKLATYNAYTPGQTSVVLYEAAGDTTDFTYGELGVPACTLEVGTEYMPVFTEVDATQWPANRPAYVYTAKIARTPYMLARGPDAGSISATVNGVDLDVAAGIDDRDNGAQDVAAAEFYVDIPPWAAGAQANAMSATDGSFSRQAEWVDATISAIGIGPGRHILFVRGRDSDGNWGPVSAAFFEIVNASPTVDAGVDDAVAHPDVAALDGTVNDDRLPFDTLTTTWSMESGPAPVAFGDTAQVDTTADFTVDGTYVLKLTADDGDQSASDTLTVTVTGCPVNQAPVVFAGNDATVTLPAAAALDGTVTDDGLPGGAIATTWSMVTGAGTATFADPAAVDTTATFSQAGTYVLRLTADDGVLSGSGNVTITVQNAGGGGGGGGCGPSTGDPAPG
ncbi:MAG: M14 family zinc carboxypeptidase, partial [Planctomycetota bacterium]